MKTGSREGSYKTVMHGGVVKEGGANRKVSKAALSGERDFSSCSKGKELSWPSIFKHYALSLTMVNASRIVV